MPESNHFNSEREFLKTFPGRIFVCCHCNNLTTDPNICTNCGGQANVLFGDIYEFTIADEPPRRIFKPIEYEKRLKSDKT